MHASSPVAAALLIIPSLQLTQFVGHDVINKNTTDLAVRCSTGSVELSCVAINTPLGPTLLEQLPNSAAGYTHADSQTIRVFAATSPPTSFLS